MKTFLLAALAALAFEAHACGVCIDDKIASCYDHALVTQAKARGHAVAFFGIQGDILRGPALRRRIAKAIEATPGVLRGSGRVSLENAALSFVIDPGRTTLEAARRDLAARLAADGLRLAHLRTL